VRRLMQVQGNGQLTADLQQAQGCPQLAVLSAAIAHDHSKLALQVSALNIHAAHMEPQAVSGRGCLHACHSTLRYADEAISPGP
jgi:hypothetical protein